MKLISRRPHEELHRKYLMQSRCEVRRSRLRDSIDSMSSPTGFFCDQNWSTLNRRSLSENRRSTFSSSSNVKRWKGIACRAIWRRQCRHHWHQGTIPCLRRSPKDSFGGFLEISCLYQRRWGGISSDRFATCSEGSIRCQLGISWFGCRIWRVQGC